MSKKISGQCACGQIKYTTNAEPEFTVICQCRQCQRISGSGHAAQFMVPVKDTSIEGDLKFYEMTADSGDMVSSGFCPNCGSPILKKTTKMPELYSFHAGSMDDPSLYKPQIVVYEESKQPWDYVDPDIPRG